MSPPTAARACRVAPMSESSSMVWRHPRTVPSGEASALAKILTRRLGATGPAISPRPSPTLLSVAITAAASIEVGHDAVSNHKRAGRGVRIAEDHHHIVHQLDAGRGGGHRRKQPPIPQDLLIADIAVDLPECGGHAERRGAARIGHRPIRAGRHRLLPSGLGGLDPLARQQRTFDLHEMHLLRVVDPGIRHRHANGPCGLVDLHAAADLFRHEITGVCDADAQALAGDGSVGNAAFHRGPRKHRDMRTEHAFGAARHDKRNPLLDLAGRQADMRRQRGAQRRHRILPGKIIDAAIALGLSEDGQDRRRLDFARFDKPHQPRDVAGTPGRDLDDVDRCRAHGHSILPLCQKMTRCSVHPMT